MANSVYIMEPYYNHMVESQAVDCVYRIRQKQDIEVVRYVVQDSIDLVSHCTIGNARYLLQVV